MPKSISIVEEENTYLKNIIQSIPGCVYWKDIEGVYLGCNLFFVKMTGLSSIEEVIGKTDKDLCWKDQAETLRSHDMEVILNDKPIVLEETVDLATGEKFIYTVMKTPLKNENGIIIGIIGTSLDITYRQKYENQLAIAKEAAEVANHAKTEFIANMSHDIRTPLTGIIGMADMLAAQVPDPEHQQYAMWLKESGHNLLELLNGVLDVVSIETVKEKEINLKPFDLKKSIKKVGQLELPTIKTKQLELKLEIDQSIPDCVVSDQTKLHRILLNLLGNAIKFTQQGYVGIKADVVKRDKEEVHIQFQVYDSGIGIPDELQTKVFDRFFRVSPSYKGIYRGHGVGLHIVQEFVTRLGGEVSLTSQVDRGTTFTFTLPLKIGNVDDLPREGEHEQDNVMPAPTPAIPPSTVSSSQTETPAMDPSLPHILLVEDNTMALKIIEGLVKAAGCRFTSATDGQQAFELAKKIPFDLIITDIGLPGLSGTELAEQIRTVEHEQNQARIPIVALTGHAGGEAEQSCLQAGIDKVLTKPANFAAINGVIKQFNVVKKDSSSALNSAPNTPKIGHLGLDLPDTEPELFNLNHYSLLDIAQGIATVGDENILKELLNLMLDKSLPSDLTAIKKAHTHHDWQQVEELAHRIKSGAIYCGTIRLRYACQYLERYLKAGHHASQERLYQQLLTVSDETIKAIEVWLQKN